MKYPRYLLNDIFHSIGLSATHKTPLPLFCLRNRIYLYKPKIPIKKIAYTENGKIVCNSMFQCCKNSIPG